MVVPYLEYELVDRRTAKRMEGILEKSYATYWKKKRIFDVIVTGLMLIVLILPMLLIGLIIWIDDPHGSPIYRQVRVGRHGETFFMYKFRSMYVDADARKNELLVTVKIFAWMLPDKCSVVTLIFENIRNIPHNAPP